MSPATAAKKPAQSDWHRADIVAALHKAGWSLVQLSMAHGVARTTLNKALHRPYPKAEAIIAKALGTTAHEIWPTRYDEHGQPNRPRGRKPLRGNVTALSVAPARGARNVIGKGRG